MSDEVPKDVQTTPFKVPLKVKLSTEERLEIYDQKQKLENEIEEREEALKELVKKKKERITNRKAKARKMGKAAESGVRTQFVECRHEINLEDRELLTLRMDTGAAIEGQTRPLTPEEFRQYSQLPLKMETPAEISKEREQDDKKTQKGVVTVDLKAKDAERFTCTVHGTRQFPCGCPPAGGAPTDAQTDPAVLDAEKKLKQPQLPPASIVKRQKKAGAEKVPAKKK